MDSDSSSFQVDTRALKVAATAGVAAGIGSIALFMMLQGDGKSDENDSDADKA